PVFRRSVCRRRRHTDNRAKLRAELVFSTIQPPRTEIRDHMIVHEDLVFLIQSNERAVEGTMMQRTKRDSVRSLVRATGSDRKDALRVYQIQLHTAERAGPAVGV